MENDGYSQRAYRRRTSSLAKLVVEEGNKISYGSQSIDGTITKVAITDMSVYYTYVVYTTPRYTGVVIHTLEPIAVFHSYRLFIC